MPVDTNVHPMWVAETKELAEQIDSLDYFEIMGCPRTAKLPEIKVQYHNLQRTYHPDTFYRSPDEALRQAVFRISKRIAEAYVILRDPVRRERYTRDITGPERAKKLRYSEQTESEVRKEKEQELGKTAQGRQLVQKAAQSQKRGDFGAAERDLKMALLFEKGNELIKARLTEVQELVKKKK